MDILTESDAGNKSLKVQNLVFEYFNIAQIRFDVNFGTSLYTITMNRGNPYITMIAKEKKKLKFVSAKNRFCTDIENSDYSPDTTFLNGNPSLRGSISESLLPGDSGGGFTIGAFTQSGFTVASGEILDNWCAIYSNNDVNAVIGWISNFQKPVKIDIKKTNDNLEYVLNYEASGNVYGIGILPSFATNLIGDTPLPFITGTQDEYVKWRANEAILACKQFERIKRR